MKKYVKNLGLGMVCVGALSLIIGYATSLTDHNALLISAAVLIVAGLVLHVYLMKRESKY